MKCSKQCMYACNKAMKVLGMIKRTVRFKDTRVIYITLFHQKLVDNKKMREKNT